MDFATTEITIVDANMMGAIAVAKQANTINFHTATKLMAANAKILIFRIILRECRHHTTLLIVTMSRTSAKHKK